MPETEIVSDNKLVIQLGEGVTATLILVKPGKYTMGSPTDEPGRWNDETQREVEITEEFWMWETPVTQAQWRAVMGTNPSHFNGDDLPVECVSWDDCTAYCAKLSELIAQQHPGAEVMLPSEEEWEYACRAGTSGPINVAGATLDDVAWYGNNSGGTTHPVKQKKPNAWGLFDMLGNVCEWTRTPWTE